MADNISVVITEIIPDIAVDTLQTIIDVDISVSEKGSPGDKGDPGTTTWAGITDKPLTFDPATHGNEAHSSSFITLAEVPADLIQSVAGRQGEVVLTKSDVGLSNVDNTSDANKPISSATQTALNQKVEIVSGKQLSTEDYTSVEKSKLAGIAAGAEVNVRTDWNATSGDAVILNKPELMPPTSHGNEAHNSEFATVAQIPSSLAYLTDDENHRTVSDAEKATWNTAIVPGGTDTNIQFNDNGVFGGVDAFKYDRLSGAITIGESVEVLPRVPLAIQKDIDDYVQVTLKNKSDAGNASMDLVITADNGTDETHYLDLGVNSSGYSDPEFPIIRANAGYLYTADDELVIGTGGAGKKVILFAGGYAEEDIAAEIDEAGINLPSGKTVRINGVPIGASPDFLSLTDTPNSYTGQAGKVVSVNPEANGLEFTSISGLGDMQSSVYDPQAIVANVFDVDNHTSGTVNSVFSQTEKTKLAGIAVGAEVNVQADWNQTSISADDYIKNKPTIPSSLTPATSVVSETTPGQTPVVGIASEYARADHSHGTPAAGSGVSEALAIAFSVALGGI